MNANTTDTAPPRTVHVLVVDDDPGSRLLVERYTDDPYITHTTEDFTAFEAFLSSDRPVNVVLADIILNGGRSGIDVLDTVRARSGPLHVPVIALTAYTVPGGRDHYLAAGFDGYISKPFTRRMLYRELGRLLP